MISGKEFTYCELVVLLLRRFGSGSAENMVARAKTCGLHLQAADASQALRSLANDGLAYVEGGNFNLSGPGRALADKLVEKVYLLIGSPSGA